MKNIKTMAQIQTEKSKSIEQKGKPGLNKEGSVIMSQRRISIDEPTSEVKQDPLR